MMNRTKWMTTALLGIGLLNGAYAQYAPYPEKGQQPENYWRKMLSSGPLLRPPP